jgi:hypothetical protein
MLFKDLAETMPPMLLNSRFDINTIMALHPKSTKEFRGGLKYDLWKIIRWKVMFSMLQKMSTATREISKLRLITIVKTIPKGYLYFYFICVTKVIMERLLFIKSSCSEFLGTLTNKFFLYLSQFLNELKKV